MYLDQINKNKLVVRQTSNDLLGSFWPTEVFDIVRLTKQFRISPRHGLLQQSAIHPLSRLPKKHISRPRHPATSAGNVV